MWARSISLVVTLVVCWICLLKETEASFALVHPQQLFCNADYVFRFRPMTKSDDNRAGRLKRLVPGGGGMMKPKQQKVEVERFYKGEKMAMKMNMMTMAPPEDPDDIFTKETTMQADIYLNYGQKPLDEDQVYIFFGRMYRYTNKTMKPSGEQKMLSSLANTMAESSVSKVMRRGFRKKYHKGCKSGCKVRTVYGQTTRKSKHYCYWNAMAFRSHMKDCCKTTQFCYKGKDGFCTWKVTKAYKKCQAENKMP